MKIYYKRKLFGAGHPQLPAIFATNFKTKRDEREFWQDHETTHAKFTRLYKKDINNFTLSLLKEITGLSKKEYIFDEIEMAKINCYC